MTSYAELTLTAIQAALLAGNLLKRGYGTAFSVENKTGGRQNLVTEYDHASEKLIIDFLRDKIPEASFLAEESGSISSHLDTSPLLWIIDPLDGTVNFAHQIPFFCVTVAAVWKGEIVAGVAYQPLLDELFTATKGEGAFLNGKRLRISTNSTPDQAMLATGFPTNIENNPHHCIDSFNQMLKQGFPIRRLGSAVLDLAYVAAGRFDAFWEVKLYPWDMAAGRLLVEEAGGCITNYTGHRIDPLHASSVIATNGPLHPLMLKVLSQT